ncbi:MAG: GtrA family protein [Bryobacteraceae bacterium]
MSALTHRWLKFNAVGGIGIAVQLGALALFKGAFGWHYLVATALAVEAAVLHNFLWHERWTWADRPAGFPERMARLARFHLGNGLVSIVSNVLLMRIFVGSLGMPYLPANLAAVAITSIANFLLSEYFVFRARVGP